MATTTNFGWETPDDTDLVKDGAAAIRTALGGVDTSFVDLKGGTTGQILSKASNTDLDYAWITNDVGDITGVTAGTGLSGGGTSGAVTLSIDTLTTVDLTTAQTLTNKTLTSPVLTTPTISTIDAKGDLLAGTADNTIGRLAVGTNGQLLQADSTTATGLKWATVSSTPTYAGASLSNNGTVTVASNTWTAIPYPQEEWDTDNFHSTSTNNSRFTIPTGKAGKYLFTITLDYEGYNGWANSRISVYKNGAQLKYASQFANGTTGGGFGFTLSGIVDAAVGDYYETYAWQNTGVSRAYYPGVTNSNCTWAYLGA
jgi:hypothetical protein